MLQCGYCSKNTVRHDRTVKNALKTHVNKTAELNPTSNELKKKIILLGAWMSFLVFRCNDPTYYPSFITLYGNVLLDWCWLASPAWHAHN